VRDAVARLWVRCGWNTQRSRPAFASARHVLRLRASTARHLREQCSPCHFHHWQHRTEVRLLRVLLHRSSMSATHFCRWSSTLLEYPFPQMFVFCFSTSLTLVRQVCVTIHLKIVWLDWKSKGNRLTLVYLEISPYIGAYVCVCKITQNSVKGFWWFWRWAWPIRKIGEILVAIRKVPGSNSSWSLFRNFEWCFLLATTVSSFVDRQP